jgi:hypothetical protein
MIFGKGIATSRVMETDGAVSLMVTCLRWTHKPQSGLELIP